LSGIEIVSLTATKKDAATIPTSAVLKPSNTPTYWYNWEPLGEVLASGPGESSRVLIGSTSLHKAPTTPSGTSGGLVKENNPNAYIALNVTAYSPYLLARDSGAEG